MFDTPRSSLLLATLASVALFALTAAVTPARAADPDAGLFASYAVAGGHKHVYWRVCGATVQDTSCHGSGSVGPFGYVGGVIEGNGGYNATSRTERRHFYVCDTAAGGTGVTVYDYARTDQIATSGGISTVKLAGSVVLPIVGGVGAKCYLAGDANFLFVGTSNDMANVKVSKDDLSYTNNSESGGPMTSMSADSYGNIDTTFGQGNFFMAYSPDGNFEEYGGGVDYFVGTSVGLSMKEVPNFSICTQSSNSHMGAGAKTAPQHGATTQDVPVDSALASHYFSGCHHLFVDYDVCGKFDGYEGCFTGSEAAPFGHVGSLLESPRTFNAKIHTETRYFYVCDDATPGNGVALDVYKRIDTYHYDGLPTVSTALTQVTALPLALPGGITSNCMMASGGNFIYVGTGLGTGVVKVDKSSFAVTPIPGPDPSLKLTVLTADRHGYVAASYGATATANAYQQFDTSGQLVQSGPGAWFALNTFVGVLTRNIPAAPPP